MVRSMTAFGRHKDIVGGKDITVEIRSVNNRYFDCTAKISRAYSALESKIKPYLQSKGISRGKVDVYVGVEVVESEGIEVSLDTAYAKGYIEALQRLRDEFSLKDDISVMSVAQNRDIFKVKTPDEDMEKDWTDILQVFDVALANFFAAREAEGANLEKDIRAKLEGIKANVTEIEKVSLADIGGYRQKLEERLRQMLADNKITMDENRILTECAIFADRIAIDEELVRLRSHFDAFGDILAANEPVGRKLDFLFQEINRETNTIGSKCNNLGIAHIVVEVKTELEKIREQIQNIE